MVKQKIKSEIKPNCQVLEIVVEYQRAIKQEDVDVALDYFQLMKSMDKSNHYIPKGKIFKKPKVGEMQTEIAYFIVRLGEKIYHGLDYLKHNAPYVIPKLIDDLKNYEKENEVSENQIKLIEHAISGLEEIFNNEYLPNLITEN